MLLWPQGCSLCNRNVANPHLAPRTGRWYIPLIGASVIQSTVTVTVLLCYVNYIQDITK